MYIPTSTYRVQLHKDFNLNNLQQILDYLRRLGISTIYASPLTQAEKGSQHGYDVVDPQRINPEIGTETELTAIHDFMQEHQMGWLQDIVPNHMAFSMENGWLYDVLARGNISEFYSFFDIIPENPFPGGEQIMVPFLGKELEACLDARGISLAMSDKGFEFCYADALYPVSIFSYNWICGMAGSLSTPLLSWSKKLESFALLPYDQWNRFKPALIAEVRDNPRSRAMLDEYVEQINQDRSLLRALLSFQHYRLCSWRESRHRMNYRRFFAINSLICLQMEDENVFDVYHQYLRSLYDRGLIQGLRIDHIDGLARPGEYVQRLRNVFGDDCYLADEKILQSDELPLPGWPLQGTTGYDFLGFENQLLLDNGGRQKLQQYYKENYSAVAYDSIVFEKKYAFLKAQFGGEQDNLLRLLQTLFPEVNGLCTLVDLKEAMAILLAAFPVYRIYPEEFPLSDTDRKYVHLAFERAITKRETLRPVFNWLKTLFDADKDQVRRQAFIERWSQFTAPLAAKGTEDTVFYRYNPLISLNEVGDSPGRENIDAAEFHRLMQERHLLQPLAMNASSTHDTKRGEDNRLRINMLTVYAGEWIACVENWKKENEGLLIYQGQRRMPSKRDEYLIYQALVGAYGGDEFAKRFQDYLLKAIREANTDTSYDAPDEAYESACHRFVAGLLAPDSIFLQHFIPFHQQIAATARRFSLSQTVLKLLAPGIPDIYQGAECWDFSLVDPDNRRPVDFTFRLRMLECMEEAESKGWPAVQEWLDQQEVQGMQKMYFIKKLLHYRRDHPDLFSKGTYIPIIANTEWIAFMRQDAQTTLLVIAGLPCSSPANRKYPLGFSASAENILTGEILELNAEFDPAAMAAPYAASVFELRTS